MSEQAVQLFSIGHSNVEAQALIDLLRRHAIATVCDVRSAPYSRYNPQFNREALAASLQDAGIVYRFLGDALGGKSTGNAVRTADGAPPDYDTIRAEPRFVRGLDQLIALGSAGPTAFMCAEADYHSCHRHRLISPALIGRGVTVWHIMHDGRLEQGTIEARQMRMF
ncbi:MAG TPA: DUF488 domain-containing protein [Roseiflexaceae bacterium]|nr:DUF488 domain-containing protein [Roseiflexaceae bacterium]